jgi:hypothetical protein
MRTLLLGTDFIKDIDGSLKALETNTDIFIGVPANLYLNTGSLDNIITDNNITEVVYVNKVSSQSEGFDVELTPNPLNKIQPLDMFLRLYCENKSITFQYVQVEKNSITVPNIEDTSNKLIIRGCYDTTALVDDTYARDNWEFLKLMYDVDPTSIPKTYINDSTLGFDSIGTDIRDNGIHPNFLIKKRTTPSNEKVYPILHKVESVEQLDNIKSNLLSDEYLQEYIFNPSELLDNRLKHYRSVDLICGGNLDVVNLWCVENSNSFELETDCDYTDNNIVQWWDRPKYLPKMTNFGETQPKLSADTTTRVLNTSNQLQLASSLNIGDTVTSLIIPGLPLDEASYDLSKWSSSFSDVVSNSSVSSSALQNKTEITDYIGVVVNFETTDGHKFSDVDQAMVLVKNKPFPVSGSFLTASIGDQVNFTTFGYLKEDDVVLLYNSITQQLEEKVIADFYYTIDRMNAYVLDFEQLDLFLTMEEGVDNPTYGIVTHNYSYSCRTRIANYPWKICGYACAGGWWGCFWSTWYCTRCNGGGAYGSNCNYGGVWCRSTWWGFYGGWTCAPWVSNGGMCNWQKSDVSYKENIKPMGITPEGIPYYQYNYNNNKTVYEGIIAQDLIGTKFEKALKRNIDGLLIVNYDMLDIKMKTIN